MPFWGWSKTAASNANSDPTINWAEGMPPSAVNDSARAMEARLAEWRDDISGTVSTGGNLLAYTVASNQVFDTFAHMNGAMIAFVPHTTCGPTVTLNVDGLGAKPLRTSPGVELMAGMLIQGTPYVATYNNVDQVFYLRGFYPLPYTIPIGGCIPYIGVTAPNSNFAYMVGQAISRTTYATLFSLVGGTYGGGDGSTTFNIPDLRGRTIFGQDGMGGAGITTRISIAGGNFDATVLGATGGAQSHTLTQAELLVVTPTGTVTVNDQRFALIGNSGGGPNTYQTGSGSAGITATFTGNPFGSGNSHPILPPAIAMPYILRVI
jgi:microcystin-dependent protein